MPLDTVCPLLNQDPFTDGEILAYALVRSILYDTEKLAFEEHNADRIRHRLLLIEALDFYRRYQGEHDYYALLDHVRAMIGWKWYAMG